MGVMGILSRDRQNNAFRWLLIGGKRNSSERRGYAAARGEGAVGNSTLLGGDGWSSCGQQADDVLDCLIGPMVGSLKATVGSVLRIGLMVKATVGEGTT